MPVLNSGEFVTEAAKPNAPTDLPPGHTSPSEAVPGVTVYVEPGDGGPLAPCSVPPDFAPPQQ